MKNIGKRIVSFLLVVVFTLSLVLTELTLNSLVVRADEDVHVKLKDGVNPAPYYAADVFNITVPHTTANTVSAVLTGEAFKREFTESSTYTGFSDILKLMLTEDLSMHDGGIKALDAVYHSDTITVSSIASRYNSSCQLYSLIKSNYSTLSDILNSESGGIKSYDITDYVSVNMSNWNITLGTHKFHLFYYGEDLYVAYNILYVKSPMLAFQSHEKYCSIGISRVSIDSGSFKFKVPIYDDIFDGTRLYEVDCSICIPDTIDNYVPTILSIYDGMLYNACSLTDSSVRNTSLVKLEELLPYFINIEMYELSGDDKSINYSKYSESNSRCHSDWFSSVKNTLAVNESGSLNFNANEATTSTLAFMFFPSKLSGVSTLDKNSYSIDKYGMILKGESNIFLSEDNDPITDIIVDGAGFVAYQNMLLSGSSTQEEKASSASVPIKEAFSTENSSVNDLYIIPVLCGLLDSLASEEAYTNFALSKVVGGVTTAKNYEDALTVLINAIAVTNVFDNDSSALHRVDIGLGVSTKRYYVVIPPKGIEHSSKEDMLCGFNKERLSSISEYEIISLYELAQKARNEMTEGKSSNEAESMWRSYLGYAHILLSINSKQRSTTMAMPLDSSHIVIIGKGDNDGGEYTIPSELVFSSNLSEDDEINYAVNATNHIDAINANWEENEELMPDAQIVYDDYDYITKASLMVDYYIANIYGYTVRSTNSLNENEVEYGLDNYYYNKLDQVGASIWAGNLQGSLWENMPAISLPSGYSSSDQFKLMYMVALITRYLEDSDIWPTIEGSMETLQQVSDKLNYEDATDQEISTIHMYRSVKYISERLGVTSWGTNTQKLLDATYLNDFLDNQFIYYQINSPALNESPLRPFFAYDDDTMSLALSSDWRTGFGLSATFVPLQTNLYDPTSIGALDNEDWITNYYYKYGFYRKALYIDNDSQAAVNLAMTGQKGSRRVCTLEDLVECNGDIVLYIDDNFYNLDLLSAKLDTITYSSIRTQGIEYASTEEQELVEENPETQTTTSFFEKIKSSFNDMIALDAEKIFKNGNFDNYDVSVKNTIRQYGNEEVSPSLNTLMYEVTFLDDDAIDAGVAQSDYSIQQPYAIVSAVYRNNSIFNKMTSYYQDGVEPVFVASNTVAKISGIENSSTGLAQESLINYSMVMNLENLLLNDAETTLDLSQPVFMDLFGNIVTESGYVVIPAASNATITGFNNWTPLTMGFATAYGPGEHLVADDYRINPFDATESAAIDSDGEYVFSDYKLSMGSMTAIMSYSAPNSNSAELKSMLATRSNTNSLKFEPSNIMNIILEVMRGAPLEDIDYTKEGIQVNQDIDATGVSIAAMLENITDSTKSGSSGNGALTLPNLAFLDGYQYVILYLFKLVFAVLIVGLLFNIFKDALKHSLGFKSFGMFIITVLSVVVGVYMIPVVLNTTYYAANKTLLRDEMSYISLLNEVKRQDGQEIGITSVEYPESETEFYLKLESIDMPWYQLLGKVLFSDTRETFDDFYEEQFKQSLMSNMPNVKRNGDGIYISTNDIYDSTQIVYSTVFNKLVSGYEDVETVSYTVPYTYFLDVIIAEINYYNEQNDIGSYSTGYGADGTVYTYDFITPYFYSEEFMVEGYDITGLMSSLDATEARGVSSVGNRVLFTDEEKASMQNSYWYLFDRYTEEQNQDKIAEVESYMRAFVIDNRDVLGKVPDAIFLKVMALSVALKFNDVYNLEYGSSLEIFNVDSRDLLRIMVSNRADTFKWYSYSFARYTYEIGGTFSVIMFGLVSVILWITSLLKPIIIGFLIILLVINTVGRKFLFKHASKAVEGYLLAMSCLGVVNILYALMLKLSISISNLTGSPLLSACIAIVVQVAYIMLLCSIITIVIKDWRNMGYNTFQTSFLGVTAQAIKARDVVTDNITAKQSKTYNEVRGEQQYLENSYSPVGKTAKELFDELHARDENRIKKGDV